MIKFITLIICMSIIYCKYHQNQFFSSTTNWVICYVLIFLLYPLCSDNIYINETLIDIMALVGITTFFIGAFFGSNIVVSKTYMVIKNRLKPNFNTALIMFSLGFIVSLIMLFVVFGAGNVKSVINGSMTGKQMMLFSGSSISHLYSCSLHFSEGCLMALLISASTKKEIKRSICCLGLYFTVSILFGFTRIFLLALLAILVMFYGRYIKKVHQLFIGISGLVLLILIMVAMNFIRTFGFNNDLYINDFTNIKYFLESTDFGASYVWLDKLLLIDPPYLNLLTYLKPFLVFIPRIFWEDKFEQSSMQLLKILDPGLAASGYSTAGYSVIGEGYAFFGYIGVLIFPFIWGLLCAYFDKRYYSRLSEGDDRCISNIFYYIYAVFIVLSGQRGDWNQYLFVVIYFYFIPIYISTFEFKLRT